MSEGPLFKVLVVGEGGTGKTCIIRRYVHNIFQMSTKTTIGVDFALKVLNWDQNRSITLQIWDIAGQERYGHMTRVYYQAAVAAMVVYDVTRGDTFEAVAKWKHDIDNKVFLPDGSNIPCLLLANKSDLPEDPAHTDADLDKFCEENKFGAWFRTSSKNNTNIEEAFTKLVQSALDNDERLDQGKADPPPPEGGKKVKAGEGSGKKQGKKCC